MTALQQAIDVARKTPPSKWKPRIGRVGAACLATLGANPEVSVPTEGSGVMFVDARDRTTCDLAWNGPKNTFAEMLGKLCLALGPTFYDIGANVGLMSVPVGLMMPPELRSLVCFEPVPRNAKRLRKNLRENGLEATSQVHEVALGDTKGEIVLHVESTLGSTSGNAYRSARPSQRIKTTAVHVEVVPLDDLHDSHMLPAPSVMKIDTEGQEMAVLRGARQILELARPVIFGEFNGELMDELGETVLDLPAVLPANYAVYAFLSLSSIQRVALRHGLGDLLLVPEERIASLPLKVIG